MSRTPASAARSAVNRVLVACHDEVAALDEAASVVSGTTRTSRLRYQARRRVGFARDLCVGVGALGGVPARGTSYAAKLRSSLRSLRRLLAGPHAGDAVAACSRATEKTARAYAVALEVVPPGSIRAGLARQHAEVVIDRTELRRMRWGATPTVIPGRDVREFTDAAARRSDATDVRALESWSDDGGPGAGADSGERARPTAIRPRRVPPLATR